MIPVIEWDAAAYHRKFAGSYVWIKPKNGVPIFVSVDDVVGHDDHLSVIIYRDIHEKTHQKYLLNGAYPSENTPDECVTIMYSKPPVGVFDYGKPNQVFSCTRNVEKTFRQGFSSGSPFKYSLYGLQGPDRKEFMERVVQKPKSRFHITGPYVYYLDTRIGIVDNKEKRLLVDNERIAELVRKECPEWTVVT